MSIHINWEDEKTAGKIALYKGAWFTGCSAAKIAAKVGTTRNAIIGLFHRHGAKHFPDMPLLPVGTNQGGTPSKQRRAAVTRRAPVTFIRPEPSQPKPLPVPRLTDHEVRLCGKPLVMLKAHECKWPVNQADVGELHLFCGMHADGSYCGHHKNRAHREAT